MNLDTYIMITRTEQERRAVEAERYSRLFEGTPTRRGNRAGFFSRHTRKAT